MCQAVKDSEPLRTAVDEVQPERVKLSLRLSQSKPLYEAFKGIKEGDLWGQLSEAQQRIVDGELRDFVLGGVALEVRQMTGMKQSCIKVKHCLQHHCHPETAVPMHRPCD